MQHNIHTHTRPNVSTVVTKIQPSPGHSSQLRGDKQNQVTGIEISVPKKKKAPMRGGTADAYAKSGGLETPRLLEKIGKKKIDNV